MAYNKPAGWHGTATNDEAWRTALSFFSVYFFLSSSLSSFSLFFFFFSKSCVVALPLSRPSHPRAFRTQCRLPSTHLPTHLRSVATKTFCFNVFLQMSQVSKSSLLYSSAPIIHNTHYIFSWTSRTDFLVYQHLLCILHSCHWPRLHTRICYSSIAIFVHINF